ncbi:disease resistance protein RPP8-like [Andrographis paniculata]|uniref:disease resistance protein RPP8-like n=1 Tax=Andrographis paniculata TaxID=175694 RepID=UPI0021E73928|nr:disease resistance protein RPP8-like [Andrographis paniculata]
MNEAAVNFLLGNVQQLLLYHIRLIKGARGQVERLERDLRLFKAFLEDSAKKRRKDNCFREAVRQIGDVVYAAEDTIDAFVTLAICDKDKDKGIFDYFFKLFKKPLDLHEIASQVAPVRDSVKEIYDKYKDEFARVNGADRGAEETEAPLAVQKNVVGFEDEARKIIGYLTEEKQELDVISVIGMPGQGKTTLAGKIFHDEKIQYEFPTRIWVYVSQQFSKKDIYLAILKEFTRIDDNVRRQHDRDLAELVSSHLQSGKYLIVMDDVWTTQDWDKIQTALPKAFSGGKVLITSRHGDVARHANKQRPPHNLRPLTQEESWELLQYEVFGKPECPSELVNLGKLIVKQCDGLPLAIVVIGGILLNLFAESGDPAARKVAWERVSNSVSAYLNEDPQQRMEKLIGLSYDNLPYHLRACFLYLGMFPEGFKIPAWKLIRLWIAEGFIQQKDGITLEETAEIYLDELINRNLMRVDKRRPDGRVKTCNIHDMLRDFCKTEAGSERENFIQEIRMTPEGFQPRVDTVGNYRRICIHSNVVNFITMEPCGQRVRSFVCFSNEEAGLPPENTSSILAAFKLLRVLDVKPIIFEKLSSDMYKLMHLRYIVLSFKMSILPAAFAKLWNIETLVVDTSQRTLEIKADIWKMRQLRHLKTNVSATLPKVGKSDTESGKLQTLGKISHESCTEEFFDRARTLKQLCICGRLASLLNGKAISFNGLEKLGSLEKLKLLNDAWPSAASESKLCGLPRPYQFPPKLKSLTLAHTFLDWSHMSILGLLENLEVLKLKDKAFSGKIWEAKDGGFRRLEVLHIARTDLTFWMASHHHYPRLRHLVLHNCEELKEVPIGLADIPTFGHLELHHTADAVDSAIKIRKAKQRKGQEPNTSGAFELKIFPPHIQT